MATIFRIASFVVAGFAVIVGQKDPRFFGLALLSLINAIAAIGLIIEAKKG